MAETTVAEVMAELGIDLSAEKPTKLTVDAVEASDVVITMGCGDVCPIYPGKRYEDWNLDDPAGQGIEAVRPIRDEIRARVLALAFLVRGIGDVIDLQGSWLSWFSPLAWAQQTRVHVDLRWWPLLVPLLAVIALLMLGGCCRGTVTWGRGCGPGWSSGASAGCAGIPRSRTSRTCRPGRAVRRR